MMSEQCKEYPVSIGGINYIVMDAVDEGAGWRIAGSSRKYTGTMYNGKPYEADRATRFPTLEHALRDLQDHLSYYHSVRRVDSRKILQHILEQTND
jgi:hypothetical protein